MSQQLWVWNFDDQRLYYDKAEMVRFRVIGEEWHDQTPTKPIDQGENAAKSSSRRTRSGAA